MDFRSDQFSFGSILYEMATGRRAFPHENSIDALSAILHDEPEPCPGFCPRYAGSLNGAFAKGPGTALSTGDLARDLRSLRDHSTR